MMGRPITMDQLRQDVGLMVEKITYVTLMFRRIKLRMEEYVCLKVIIMLNPCKCIYFLCYFFLGIFYVQFAIRNFNVYLNIMNILIF